MDHLKRLGHNQHLRVILSLEILDFVDSVRRRRSRFDGCQVPGLEVVDSIIIFFQYKKDTW